MKRSSITGFTLAEVLVTLVIIGVIAALTIPALIQNVQDTQLRTAWKKAYSDLNQATQETLNDIGGTFQGFCQNTNPNCLKDIYIPHLSYVKQCNRNSSYGNCWHNVTDMRWFNGNTLTTSDGSNSFDNGAAVVLNNGSFMMIYPWADSCNSGSTCGWIQVDVNGIKPPNTVGKDILGVWVYNNRIVPFGTNDGRPCNITADGTGCSTAYLKQ